MSSLCVTTCCHPYVANLSSSVEADAGTTAIPNKNKLNVVELIAKVDYRVERPQDSRRLGSTVQPQTTKGRLAARGEF